jgi:hypothetical protein
MDVPPSWPRHRAGPASLSLRVGCWADGACAETGWSASEAQQGSGAGEAARGAASDLGPAARGREEFVTFDAGVVGDDEGRWLRAVSD